MAGPTTLDRPAGWARFLWFSGDVEIKDADGKVVQTAEPKSIEAHLKEMGLSDEEIVHAMGKPDDAPKPEDGPRRTIRRGRTT